MVILQQLLVSVQSEALKCGVCVHLVNCLRLYEIKPAEFLHSTVLKLRPSSPSTSKNRAPSSSHLHLRSKLVSLSAQRQGH